MLRGRGLGGKHHGAQEVKDGRGSCNLRERGVGLAEEDGGVGEDQIIHGLVRHINQFGLHSMSKGSH